MDPRAKIEGAGSFCHLSPLEIESEMELALQQKSQLESELVQIERQIYTLETNYLEGTGHLDELIRKWSDFSSSVAPASGGGSSGTSNKKRKIHDGERIFSMSSMTAPTSTDILNTPMATHSNQMSTTNQPLGTPTQTNRYGTPTPTHPIYNQMTNVHQPISTELAPMANTTSSYMATAALGMDSIEQHPRGTATAYAIDMNNQSDNTSEISSDHLANRSKRDKNSGGGTMTKRKLGRPSKNKIIGSEDFNQQQTFQVGTQVNPAANVHEHEMSSIIQQQMQYYNN